MGGLKIYCFGYRPWAIEIFNQIEEAFQFENDVIVRVRTSNENTMNHVFKDRPDIALFYGWSSRVPDHIVENNLCLCLHPSPLPKYKGGSPIQHQIIAGETTSAVTVFKMTGEMDAGPIFQQSEFSLDGTLSDVFDRIVSHGVACTLNAIIKLRGFGQQEFERRLKPQSSVGIPLMRRRTPRESEITLENFKENTAKQLHDKIRALDDPYPNAFVVCGDGKKLYITRTEVGQ